MLLLDSMDSYPEGYVPCDCHPETCNHKDGMIFVGHSKPLADKITKEGKKILRKSIKGYNKNADYMRGYKNGYKKGKKDGWKDGYHNASNFYYNPAH
jgi:hypothetical protein